MPNTKGIAVAGNMIVDILYRVRGLPKPGELTTILEPAAPAALIWLAGMTPAA